MTDAYERRARVEHWLLSAGEGYKEHRARLQAGRVKEELGTLQDKPEITEYAKNLTRGGVPVEVRLSKRDKRKMSDAEDGPKAGVERPTFTPEINSASKQATARYDNPMWQQRSADRVAAMRAAKEQAELAEVTGTPQINAMSYSEKTRQRTGGLDLPDHFLALERQRQECLRERYEQNIHDIMGSGTPQINPHSSLVASHKADTPRGSRDLHRTQTAPPRGGARSVTPPKHVARRLQMDGGGGGGGGAARTRSTSAMHRAHTMGGSGDHSRSGSAPHAAAPKPRGGGGGPQRAATSYGALHGSRRRESGSGSGGGGGGAGTTRAANAAAAPDAGSAQGAGGIPDAASAALLVGADGLARPSWHMPAPGASGGGGSQASASASASPPRREQHGEQAQPPPTTPPLPPREVVPRAVEWPLEAAAAGDRALDPADLRAAEGGAEGAAHEGGHPHVRAAPAGTAAARIDLDALGDLDDDDLLQYLIAARKGGGAAVIPRGTRAGGKNAGGAEGRWEHNLRDSAGNLPTRRAWGGGSGAAATTSASGTGGQHKGLPSRKKNGSYRPREEPKDPRREAWLRTLPIEDRLLFHHARKLRATRKHEETAAYQLKALAGQSHITAQSKMILDARKVVDQEVLRPRVRAGGREHDAIDAPYDPPATMRKAPMSVEDFHKVRTRLLRKEEAKERKLDELREVLHEERMRECVFHPGKAPAFAASARSASAAQHAPAANMYAQAPLAERSLAWVARREERLSSMKRASDADAMEGCTFAPYTNTDVPTAAVDTRCITGYDEAVHRMRKARDVRLSEAERRDRVLEPQRNTWTGLPTVPMAPRLGSRDRGGMRGSEAGSVRGSERGSVISSLARPVEPPYRGPSGGGSEGGSARGRDGYAGGGAGGRSVEDTRSRSGGGGGVFPDGPFPLPIREAAATAPRQDSYTDAPDDESTAAREYAAYQRSLDAYYASPEYAVWYQTYKEWQTVHAAAAANAAAEPPPPPPGWHPHSPPPPGQQQHHHGQRPPAAAGVYRGEAAAGGVGAAADAAGAYWDAGKRAGVDAPWHASGVGRGHDGDGDPVGCPAALPRGLHPHARAPPSVYRTAEGHHHHHHHDNGGGGPSPYLTYLPEQRSWRGAGGDSSQGGEDDYDIANSVDPAARYRSSGMGAGAAGVYNTHATAEGSGFDDDIVGTVPAFAQAMVHAHQAAPLDERGVGAVDDTTMDAHGVCTIDEFVCRPVDAEGDGNINGAHGTGGISLNVPPQPAPGVFRRDVSEVGAHAAAQPPPHVPHGGADYSEEW